MTFGYGAAKYGSTGLLASSVDRGWSTLSAELHRHDRGAFAWKNSPEHTEICVDVRGSGSVVTRRGEGFTDRTVAEQGTIWISPAGLQEECIDNSNAAPEILHIYLHRGHFSPDLLGFDLTGSPTASLRYETSLQDPLLAEIAYAILSELEHETSADKTVEEARWLEARGVDAVIAQGSEAGGHRATFLSPDIVAAMASQPGTLALVPQIADSVSVPVIAAGGIAEGRGIAAAFALGASGAQLGTAYLRCPEAATPSGHREALRHARADATVLTNVFSGRPARALANRLALDLGPISDAAPDFPLPVGELARLRAKAEQQASCDFTPLWAGQVAPLAMELPAKALTLKLADDSIARLKRLGRG